MNAKIMKDQEFNPMDMTLDAYTIEDAFACETEFVEKAYDRLSDSLIDDYYGDPADVDLEGLYDDMFSNFKLWTKANIGNVYEDSDDAIEDFVNFCKTPKLNECGGVQTSAEFQRMAPGKKQKMIIPSSRKALGKKDKYNTLGERKNEAYTGDRPRLSQTVYRDGYLAAKEGKDPIADNPYQDPYGYHYSQWEKGYMDYCHGKEMRESRSNRKPLKEEGDLNSVLNKLQRARGCVGVNGQLRYQYPNVCNSMAYLDEAIEELKNFMGL